MKNNIKSYLNKLQAYRTAIQNLHWSSKNMSEHKLLDELNDIVGEHEDKVAEVAQGIFGQIKINELRPRRYNITDSRKMLQDLYNDTMKFHATTKSKQMIGLRSEVESFITTLNQYDYLLDFCLKEDLKRRLKYKINENRLRTLVHESVIKVLNNI